LEETENNKILFSSITTEILKYVKRAIRNFVLQVPIPIAIGITELILLSEAKNKFAANICLFLKVSEPFAAKIGFP